jgi:hypothetical protein
MASAGVESAEYVARASIVGAQQSSVRRFRRQAHASREPLPIAQPARSQSRMRKQLRKRRASGGTCTVAAAVLKQSFFLCPPRPRGRQLVKSAGLDAAARARPLYRPPPLLPLPTDHAKRLDPAAFWRPRAAEPPQATRVRKPGLGKGEMVGAEVDSVPTFITLCKSRADPFGGREDSDPRWGRAARRCFCRVFLAASSFA